MLNAGANREIERVVIDNTLPGSVTESQPRSWTIVVPRIPGYVHVAALQELVDAVFYGLRRLLQDVSLGNPRQELPANAILIGAHLLSPEECYRVPDHAVVYNSEHANSDWMNTHYRALLGRVIVWDYSLDNTRMLERLLGRPVSYVPLGYVPEFTRITAPGTEDIDVLFCGSHAARRAALFDSIRARGLTFHHAFGIYGAERDALMTRAKIVLNVHAHVPGAFEMVRVSYQLANRKAVVSEVNPGEWVDTDLDGAFIAAAYEDIVARLVELVADAPAREAIGLAGFHKFSSRDQAAILRQALGERIA